MKKIISVFLAVSAVLACALFFVSCADKESPTTASGTLPESVVSEQTTAQPESATSGEVQTALTSVTGEKINISIEVVSEDGSSKIFPLTTSCTNLADALTSSGIAQGSVGQYGFTVITVNGITADYNTSNSYWAISVNGTLSQTGASAIELANGGVYTLTYTTF